MNDIDMNGKWEWPLEVAKVWEKNTAMMRGEHQRAIKWRRINATVSLGNAVMAAVHAAGGAYWLTLMSLLLCWWIYRLYKASIRRVLHWRECIHHASRVRHETNGRAQWHFEQIEATLIEMGAKVKDE